MRCGLSPSGEGRTLLGPGRLRGEEAGAADEASGDECATGLEDVTTRDGGWKR